MGRDGGGVRNHPATLAAGGPATGVRPRSNTLRLQPSPVQTRARRTHGQKCGYHEVGAPLPTAGPTPSPLQAER